MNVFFFRFKNCLPSLNEAKTLKIVISCARDVLCVTRSQGAEREKETEEIGMN